MILPIPVVLLTLGLPFMIIGLTLIPMELLAMYATCPWNKPRKYTNRNTGTQ